MMTDVIIGALVLSLLFTGVLLTMARAAARMADRISWHEDESDVE